MRSVIFPVDQRTVGSRAVRTAIYRASRDQKQKADVTNVWEGEGGKPAPSRDNAKGFGVFVDSDSTS